MNSKLNRSLPNSNVKELSVSQNIIGTVKANVDADNSSENLIQSRNRVKGMFDGYGYKNKITGIFMFYFLFGCVY